MATEIDARKNIDKMLVLAGWTIQNKNEINFLAGRGIVVREFSTSSGPTDYALFIDRIPIGVIEAKKEDYGGLSGVEEQADKYRKSKFKWAGQEYPLRFVYLSTGLVTWFTDYNDIKARSRQIFSFHMPETLNHFINDSNTLRNRLKKLPVLEQNKLWNCQYKAIKNLEDSFGKNKPRALVQMATGSGKTFTAITSVYRLLKHANAKRILFLVDTKNLGIQAEGEFKLYKPYDDQRMFPELYNVQRLKTRYIPKDIHVCISTIQRMYSILQDEELDESLEENSLYETKLIEKQKEVIYNQKIPPEFFDFIIIDECHRSIYNLWRQVLDYFDAFLIGLTATPDKRTFGFFNENVVSEYSHTEAVADNVNVPYDIYTIETEITKNGAVLKAKQYIEKRERLTRKMRWDQLDEDVEYTGKDLDRHIVNPSQIRNIIRIFKEKVETDIFPGRKELPKTLIFAKTDNHAEDIVNIVREEFGEGNDFCKKITCNAVNPEADLTSFRNDYYPRIAVTVAMIATGTDVKSVECLLFMRDVKSRGYFDQMKGRGTRIFSEDNLKKVSPSAFGNKTHFVIIDAVGVCKSLKTDSVQLERKPSVPLKDLMMNVVFGTKDEDTLTSMANRLTRLDKALDNEEKEKFIEISGGMSLTEIVRDLLNTYDPDKIEEHAKGKFKPDGEPSEEELKQAQDEMIKTTTDIFQNPKLRDFIENARKRHEQIIDKINLDKVNFAGWDNEAKEKGDDTIISFRKFIEDNKNEIIALKIYYNQPYSRKEITYKVIKELTEAMNQPPYILSIERLWHAYYQQNPPKVRGYSDKRMLTDIVSLLRYELKIDDELAPYSEIVNRNFKDWVFKKNAGHRQFTDEQMDWLRMIKDHIISSVCIDRESFDLSPFDSKGGIGKFYELFGEDYEKLMDEINMNVAA
jgi:type I restriction enzyme, R subunit